MIPFLLPLIQMVLCERHERQVPRALRWRHHLAQARLRSADAARPRRPRLAHDASADDSLTRLLGDGRCDNALGVVFAHVNRGWRVLQSHHASANACHAPFPMFLRPHNLPTVQVWRRPVASVSRLRWPGAPGWLSLVDWPQHSAARRRRP